MPDFLWSLHYRLFKGIEFPGIHQKLRNISNESQLSTSEWKELRNQNLRNLLIFAANNVPYYQMVFKQTGFDPHRAKLPDEMIRLPILTKSTVRHNTPQLIAQPARKSHMFENATGGSTGRPLRFFQDTNYKTTGAALDAYVRAWWNIKPYDRTALVWGEDREFYDMSLRERFYRWRSRKRSLNAFRMNHETLHEFCRMLNRWRPPYLMGYASALEALAKCAKDNGINTLKFRAIQSTAEVLYPHQRTQIEEAFNTPVYNFYGSRESSNLAAECPEHRNLHLISTWRYVEIIDEKGRSVQEGEPGYIVLTDLSNYAMPFIRYRNEDIARLTHKPCLCGRPSPILKDLLGRSTDIIYTPRGHIIHGEYFTHLFYGRDDIRQFQIRQTALNRLVVRYVPLGDPPVQYMRQVAAKIRSTMGEEVTIDIELCTDIPVPRSGKRCFTISDIDPKDFPISKATKHSSHIP
ncbi:MAG: hypothetical protein SWH78_17690 [Thermodesulfobacteriota bacterium]|nr:hypothetical protein [Thermodesulfobacteriota bacterium]